MKNYTVTLKTATGKIKVKTTAETEQEAILKACMEENLPESAVLKTASKSFETNQKHIYAKAFSYILEAINPDGYNVELKTDKAKLQFICDTFKKEYGHHIKTTGQQRAFESWLMGLPSCFNIDFENYRIIEIAKEWGSLDEKATEKQEDKILLSWWRFIYMRFIGLCRKNGVKF